MTSSVESDFMGVKRWKSDRFEKDVKGLRPIDHFYDDEDPRIHLIMDKWGDEIWVVGYVDPIPGIYKDIPGKKLEIRLRDNVLLSFYD